MIRKAVRIFRIVGAAAIFACFSASIYAQVPIQQHLTSPQAANRIVSAEELKRLGFYTTTQAIKNGEYARLLVVPYVVGEGNDISARCLQDSMWGFDLRSLLRPDSKTELGVRIDSPLIPSAVLAPLTLTKTRSSRRNCFISTNRTSYVSPLYIVNENRVDSFTITAFLSVSNRLSDDTRNLINAFAGAVAFVSGVPAAAAAPYLNTIGRRVETASVSTRSEDIFPFKITPGAVQEPMIVWGNNLVLVNEGRNNVRPETIRVVLIAQLVPVSSIFGNISATGQAPTAATEWRPNRILRTSFIASSIDSTSGGTLGEYLNTIASSEIQTYIGARSPEAVNLACRAMIAKIEAHAGLSQMDVALASWALAKQRVVNGTSNDGDIDNLSCLSAFDSEFRSAGITKVLPTPLPPSIARMKSATYVGDAVKRFFTIHGWNEKRFSGEELFKYPVSYSDASSSMMRGNATIHSVDSWLANARERDVPFLQRIDCYVYFDGNKPHPLAELAGKSVMIAFGDIPSESGRPAEVALQMIFSPVNDDEAATISSVSVLTRVNPEMRDAVLRLIESEHSCLSGYRSGLLSDVVSTDSSAVP